MGVIQGWASDYLWLVFLLLGALLGVWVSLLTWWLSPILAKHNGWYQGVEFGENEPITRGYIRLTQGAGYRTSDLFILLAGALTAGIVAVWQQSQPYSIWPLTLVLWGIIIAQLDWDHHWIPDFLSVPLLLVGLLLSPFEPDDYARSLGFACAVVIVWVLMVLVSKLRGLDAFAGGDIMLAGAAGAWLGIHGLPDFLIYTCLIYAAYNILVRWRGGSHWVPLGPAMISAIILKMLQGAQVPGPAIWVPVYFLEQIESFVSI